MNSITPEEYEEALKFVPTNFEGNRMISDDEFDKMLDDMNNPVNAQRRLAVQVKIFLDQRIDKEMAKSGILSDSTRRWVESYNDILEKLQRALHGDKSVNLHLHKVTHSQVALKMREFMKDEK